MKILITGSNGMLATDLARVLASRHQIVAMPCADLDVSDAAACLERIGAAAPDVVVNAAAMTAVDACETEAERAFAVNAAGAGNVAAAAAAVSAPVVHFSTDYVFDGTKSEPYTEDDPPSPRGVYARSKLEGEDLVRSAAGEHLILRISWAFGPNGRNFIRTIVGAARHGGILRVVDDQRGSPSYTVDLAARTRELIDAGCRGTYHVTNSGSCTWYDLAVRAIAWAGISGVEVVPVTTAEYPRAAPRPANSVLANARLAREGFPPLRSWQEAARAYVEAHLASAPEAGVEGTRRS